MQVNGDYVLAAVATGVILDTLLEPSKACAHGQARPPATGTHVPVGVSSVATTACW